MNEENNGKLRAGRHLAHVQSWGIRETQAGTPQVFVKFDLGLTWFGTLKEGRAQEITLEALVTMGFMGDDLTELVNNENALDKNKDVAVVVEYESREGKNEPQATIKWVNEVDGGNMKGKLDEKDAIAKLKSLKVKGELAHIRKEKGISEELRNMNQPNLNGQSNSGVPF